MKSYIVAMTAAMALSMTIVLGHGSAAACSLLCPNDTFTPSGSTVPANVNGAVWKPTNFVEAQTFDEDELRLIHVGTGEEVPFTLIANPESKVFWLEFGDLEDGEEYRFEAPSSCEPEGTRSEWTFAAGPAASFPSDIGSLMASEPVHESLRL